MGLTGAVPTFLHQIPTLATLMMHNTGFNGPIPLEFNNFIALQVLTIGWETMPSPDSLRSETLLELYELHDSSFLYSSYLLILPFFFLHSITHRRCYRLIYNTAEFPFENFLPNLTVLQSISFIGSRLTGNFPEFLWNMSTLQKVSFINTRFSGNLPNVLPNGPITSMCAPPNHLQPLNSHRTNFFSLLFFSSSITTSLFFLSTIGESDFTGPIPSMWFKSQRWKTWRCSIQHSTHRLKTLSLPMEHPHSSTCMCPIRWIILAVTHTTIVLQEIRWSRTYRWAWTIVCHQLAILEDLVHAWQ